MLEAGVKRGFLNPEYMRPAWRAELDQVQGFVKKKKKNPSTFNISKHSKCMLPRTAFTGVLGCEVTAESCPFGLVGRQSCPPLAGWRFGRLELSRKSVVPSASRTFHYRENLKGKKGSHTPPRRSRSSR